MDQVRGTPDTDDIESVNMAGRNERGVFEAVSSPHCKVKPVRFIVQGTCIFSIRVAILRGVIRPCRSVLKWYIRDVGYMHYAFSSVVVVPYIARSR